MLICSCVIFIQSLNNSLDVLLSNVIQPGATTRKGAHHVDRQNSEISYYADDEDGKHKKYTRRGKSSELDHGFFLSDLVNTICIT